MITNLNKYSADLFRAGRAYEQLLQNNCSESRCAGCCYSPRDDGFFASECPPVLFDLKVKTPADLKKFMSACEVAYKTNKVPADIGIVTPAEVAELLGNREPFAGQATGENQSLPVDGYQPSAAQRELKVIKGGR